MQQRRKLWGYIGLGGSALLLLLVLMAAALPGRRNALAYSLTQRYLQSWLNDELRSLGHSQQQLLSSLDSLPPSRFQYLRPNAGDGPSALFHNTNLIYWNSQHWMLPFNVLNGDYRYKLIWYKQRKSIVRQAVRPAQGGQFQLFSVLPLYRSHGIANQYLAEGYLHEPLQEVELQLGRAARPTQYLFSPEGEFLFSFELGEGGFSYPLWLGRLILFIGALSMAGLYFFGRWLMTGYAENEKRLRWVSIGFLAGFWVLSPIPQLLWQGGLFRSANGYAAPGAWLAGMLLLLWLAFGLWRQGKTQGISPLLKAALSLLGIAGLWAGLVLISHTLFYHPQLSPMLQTGRVGHSMFWLGLVLLATAGLNFYLWAKILQRAAWEALKNRRVFAAGLLLSVCVMLILVNALGWWLGLALLPLIYHGLLLFWQHYAGLIAQQRLAAPRQMLLTVLTISLIALAAWWQANQEQNLSNQRAYAQQIADENDALAEELLAELQASIAADEFAMEKLLQPFSSRELISTRIRRSFINDYFDRYVVSVQLFNAAGQAFESNALPYKDQLKDVNQQRFRTQYQGVFYLAQPDRYTYKRYLVFVPLRKGRPTLGYAIIDLQLRSDAVPGVFPELLTDRPMVNSVQRKDFSYAIYTQGQRVFSQGNFDYRRYFPLNMLSSPQLQGDGFTVAGYHHLAVQVGDRTIVVSNPLPSGWQLSTQLALHVTSLMAGMALLVLALLLVRRINRQNLSMALRIQLFFNAAFVLPLVLALVLTLSVMRQNYLSEADSAYLKRSEELASNLAPVLNQYMQGQIALKDLAGFVNNSSRLTGLDLNLYTTTGLLLHSSQPRVFDQELLVPYINPDAQANLVESGQRSMIATESIGRLSYRQTYVALQANRTGVLQGVIGIPYFESAAELEKQTTEMLAAILVLFVLLFAVFLTLSHYAASVLVQPLQRIAQHLRLHNTEPAVLEWKGSDEVGTLVGEYNNLVVRVQASARQTAQANKELAWREMAKQVAHEIKNPLTPMQLQLQHLQRAIAMQAPDLTARTKQVVEALLSQVQALNEIASSFATLAKMPDPTWQKISLAKVLQELATLHRGVLHIEPPAGSTATAPLHIMGDESLLFRILNNLVLNGLQAVHSGAEPRIHLRSEVINDGAGVLLSIADNGKGIDPAVQERIFQPNFSTRSAGTGMGLAVAQAGVQHLNGKIWFATGPEGSVFYVQLPLC